MIAVVGVLLLAVAAVCFSWVYAEVRRPRSLAWAKSEPAAQLVVPVWIGFAAAGIGLLVTAAETLRTQPLVAAYHVEIAAILAVSCGLLYLIRRRPPRRRQAGQDGTMVAHTPSAA